MERIICKECKKSFYEYPSNHRIFCCSGCYAKWKSKNWSNPWNKGLKGWTSSGSFKKGHKPWNTGKKCKILSETAKKRPMLVKGWNKGLHPEKQPRWKGGKIIFHHLKARKIMEEKLGRKLNKGEEVHHLDVNYKNNEIQNLCLFKNSSEHMKYHGFLRKCIREMIKNGKQNM